jgi:hypothetical protein
MIGLTQQLPLHLFPTPNVRCLLKSSEARFSGSIACTVKLPFFWLWIIANHDGWGGVEKATNFGASDDPPRPTSSPIIRYSDSAIFLVFLFFHIQRSHRNLTPVAWLISGVSDPRRIDTQQYVSECNRCSIPVDLPCQNHVNHDLVSRVVLAFSHLVAW